MNKPAVASTVCRHRSSGARSGCGGGVRKKALRHQQGRSPRLVVGHRLHVVVRAPQSLQGGKAGFVVMEMSFIFYSLKEESFDQVIDT
jgi:hypothetical protein